MQANLCIFYIYLFGSSIGSDCVDQAERNVCPSVAAHIVALCVKKPVDATIMFFLLPTTQHTIFFHFFLEI